MAIVSKGFKLEIENSTTDAATLTGVTLGAITEIAATAHGLAKGDVGTFASIVGTTDLNGVEAMVIAVEDDAFFLDIDSSGYDAWASGGTFTPATYTEVGEITDWDGPSASTAVIDITNLQSSYKAKMAGMVDEGQLSATLTWDLDDSGQLAVRTAMAAQSLKGWKLTYSDTSYQTFDGYAIAMSSSGTIDDKVVGNITIEISGEVSTTAA